MFIVDSHVHLWAADTSERPWPQPLEKPHRPIPLGADELLREMNAAGVNRAVIVPPNWQGWSNDVALEAVRQHPDRFAVMGRFDKDAPGARELIPAWRKERGLLGMRFTFTIQDSDDWLWADLEKYGIPVMLRSSHQLPALDGVAERHPGLKLIIDHMAIEPKTKDEVAFSEFDTLLTLARRPNVAVKTSSLPSYTSDTYPFRRVHDYLRRVYDTFGPKRMFWGSDFSKLPCPYSQMVTLFTEELPWLSSDDKTWIMGRGICEWIGWPLPSNAA